MALKIVTQPESLRDWMLRQRTVALECRLGRHWIPGITDKRYTHHEYSPQEGVYLLVQECRRGCGTVLAALIDSATGTLDPRSRYRYDARYLRKGAGRMSKEERGQIRLELLARRTGQRGHEVSDTA